MAGAAQKSIKGASMAGNNSPSTNGRNGTGKFTSGNTFGRGNPHAKKIATLRSALLQSVSSADIKKIIKGMVKKAQDGDTAAAKLILPYLIGQPATNQELEMHMVNTAKRSIYLTDDELMEIAAGVQSEYVMEVIETVVPSRNNQSDKSTISP